MDSNWVIGPFTKYAGNPVLRPSDTAGFDDWAVYNPAVVFHDGTYYMYYRAETRAESDTPYCGTSRIGLATSRDGRNFTRQAAPLLDVTLPLEAPGGLEDPRVVKVGDTWHMLYTAYHWPTGVYLHSATSKDLLHWEKQGPVFPEATAAGQESKSACVVCNPNGEAVKINGRYILYTNELTAYSEDFLCWEVDNSFSPAMFAGGEVCVAITDYKVPGEDNIVVFVAGDLKPLMPESELFYAIGEILYDRNAPTERLAHTTFPILWAEDSYEKSTNRLYMSEGAERGTLFFDSLFLHDGKWHLYYGASDQFVALAYAGTE